MTEITDQERLEPYRGYLWALAHAQLQPQLRGRIETSDVVQQTLLRAYQGLADLREKHPSVLVVWLRQILKTVLADELRRCQRGKRDIGRERTMAEDLDRSAEGLMHWLVADQTSPSVAVQRDEQLQQLTNSLLLLAVDQRDVIIMKHLQEKTLQEIADETGRSVAAVAGLLRRGLAKLREILDAAPSHE